MLTIEEIREKILPICLRYDIDRAYLFGSYARGEATEDSDVDIRIEKGSNKNLKSLLQVSGFRLNLEDALQKKVDLLTVLPQQPLYEIFRNKVLQEEVLIYER